MRLAASPPATSDLHPLPWALTLYPGAGEAGGCYRSLRRTSAVRRPGPAENPERASHEAARRARAQVRRYCAANALNRFGTLTYADACWEPSALRSDVAGFFKGLRRELNEQFAYLWTAEEHPNGHGLHVHFAVGRFIKQGLIRSVWSRGHVHIKLIGDLPTGSGVLEEARVASRYLAKYVSKDEDGGRPPGFHRYEVAQGYQPEKITVEGWDADQVIERASGYMRQQPRRVWRSDNEQGWEGPPAIWVEWAHGR